MASLAVCQESEYGRTVVCESWFQDDGFFDRISERKINDNHYLLDSTFLIDHRDLFVSPVWRDSLGISSEVSFVAGAERWDLHSGLTYITYHQYLCGYVVDDGEIILGLSDCFVASIQGNVVALTDEDCELLASIDSIAIVDSLRSILFDKDIDILEEEEVNLTSFDVVLASINYSLTPSGCTKVVMPGARVRAGESIYFFSPNGDLVQSSDQKLLRPAGTAFGTYDVTGVTDGDQLCTYVESQLSSSSTSVMVRDIGRALRANCPDIRGGCPQPDMDEWTDAALASLPLVNFGNNATLDRVHLDQVCIDESTPAWPQHPNAHLGDDRWKRTYTAFAFAELAYDYFKINLGWDGPGDGGEPLRILTGMEIDGVYGYVLNDGTNLNGTRDYYRIHLTDYLNTYPATVAHEFVHLILFAGVQFEANNDLDFMMHEGLAMVFQEAFLEDIGLTAYQPSFVDPWLRHISDVDFNANTDHKNGSLWLTVSKLMSQGGSNNGVAVPSIGFRDMSSIWFNTMTQDLTNGMTPQQFADALVIEAEMIFGPCSQQVESTVLALQSVGLASEWGDTRLIGPGPLCAELSAFPGSWPPHITISTSHNYKCAGQVTEWSFPFGWVNAQNVPNGQAGNWANHITFISYPSNTPPHYPKSYTVKARVDGRWIRRTIRFRDCYGPNEDPDPCSGVTASHHNYDRRFLNSSQRVSLLPNPVTDLMNVYTFDGLGLNYMITALDGTTMLSGVVSGDAYLDVSSLPAGLYLLYDIDHYTSYKFLKL